MDVVPSEIRLNGKVRSLASKTNSHNCGKEVSVCLSKSTLKHIYHIRLSPWKYSIVYCLGQVCASPYHVIKVNGEFVKMKPLCNRPKYYGKCMQSVQQVAKSVFQTQRVGNIEVKFVAAQSSTIRTFLLGVQLLIDHLRIISIFFLCVVVFRAQSTKKRIRILSHYLYLLGKVN